MLPLDVNAELTKLKCGENIYIMLVYLFSNVGDSDHIYER